MDDCAPTPLSLGLLGSWASRRVEAGALGPLGADPGTRWGLTPTGVGRESPCKGSRLVADSW